MKLVLASDNQGKLNELQAFLAPLNLTLVSQSTLNISSAEETGTSFLENALIKAKHAAQQAHLPALADDSGLIVDALHGAPGIYSARYAGPNANMSDNIDKLLKDTASLPKEKRQASFYCVLVFVRHAADPTPIIAQAQWRGELLFARQGEGGFGYDPIFFVPELNCSAAQLSLAQKNQISHRAQALRQLTQLLKENLD